MQESSRMTSPDRVRADARRNRERVLAAARAVFAERGLDAPMAAVARRAGVGVATLYRHFPTRDALVREAFARQRETCSRALAEALAAADPWDGLRHLVETVCALHREERGFPAAFLAAFPGAAPEQARLGRRAERDLALLVRRARESGALRPDFHPSDLVMALVAHCGMVAALPDDAAASRRLVAYLLQSFRADRANAPLPPPSALSLGALLSTARGPGGLSPSSSRRPGTRG
ncbi:helix-turn-helix domain-containing protein [Streptomyces sp. NPDC006186]|uniref:TetR/AcrR family transcriptional regulator n=1 Tax=Streptomyces sp. NPDC006186 TaxID=3155248 RepID=UPI0033B7FA50